jgi:nucleoid DNA-binding protein
LIKQELIGRISKYFKLTQFEAEKIFDDFFRAVMEGVKDDKIVELENFGEFIQKYNGQRKSVEFLPKQSVEDELSGGISVILPGTKTMPPVNDETSEPSRETVVSGDIEEELRKKREAILSKLTSVSKAEESKPEEISSGGVVPEGQGGLTEEKPLEAPKEKVTEPIETGVPEDESQRSFSDYFSVVTPPASEAVTRNDVSSERSENAVTRNDVSSERSENAVNRNDVSSERSENDVTRDDVSSERSEERVIPPSVVELHEEIVSSPIGGGTSPSGAAYQTESVPIRQDFHTNGKPYYIWYRDSEPSPQETQTLQVEYELLYQAQKEAEYRSKLKIYVTSFIMFFSFVLILLVFSPVIYKVFFTPEETEYIYQQEETPAEEISSTPTPEPESNPPVANQEHQSGITSPQPTEQTGQTTPPQQQTQTQQTQTPTAEKKTEVTTEPPQPTGQKTEQPSVESAPLQGLTKNSLGWTDEKYKVIYIALENNKYAIQESAWDSEAKAMGRIKSVAGLSIEGMTGSIVKVDLGDRGIWYRARFGEFSSLEEARKKAIELRTKERTRLSAVIVLFLSLA